jgi:hypothetical protein
MGFFRLGRARTIAALKLPIGCTLDTPVLRRYRRYMAQSILVFDFGTNEEAAQQARHKIEAWQQGSRLGKKILIKFERPEASAEAEPTIAESAAPATEKSKAFKTKSAGAKGTGDSADGGEDGKEEPNSRVRLFVRLDFSDHEKLTRQRWLDRIAAEEPFKSIEGETVRQGNPAFAKIAELFESLD